MRGEDGLDEAGDPGCRAAESAEESPGLEGGDGLFDQGGDLGLRPVDGLLASGQLVPSAAVGVTDGAAGALVALVRPAVDADLGQGVDDAVLVCGPHVVDGSGQGW